MEVVYDTGSDWLTIEGADCTNCGGDTYTYADSSTFSFLEQTQSVELEYGSATLEGLRASDEVCITNNDKEDFSQICLASFEFFLISSMNGLDDRIDGILGLSRSSANPALMREAWRGIGPTYIKHLADAGVI